MTDQPPSLEQSKTLKRARRLRQCLPLYRGALKRCWARRAPPRAAIKSFCLECCGDDRQAVTECTAYACPLWEYRPYQPRKS